MSNLAIHASGISKHYRIGQGIRHGHLRDALTGAASTIFRRVISSTSPSSRSTSTGRVESDATDLWALRDVSFEINHGEAVGFVGKNGAGKSTLLKILARITEPTEGYIDLYGRVGSLLEVGTGFHTDLTGRENVYLNGAILGMKQREIRRKFDEIVAFSEVERFIDTPVKYYSSGMYMRLAFAVAAHLDPEILLVDEALAVGDVAFQEKCLGKMGEVARSGRTVVFVSHHMPAVEALCQRVFWLSGGQLVDEGDPGRVISNFIGKTYTTWTEKSWDESDSAPGDEYVSLRSVRVVPADGYEGSPITIRTPFVIECEWENRKPGVPLSVSFVLRNDKDAVVFTARPVHEPHWHGQPFPVGRFRDRCYVPGDFLNASWHKLDIQIVRDRGSILHHEPEALVFDVAEDIETRGGWYGDWPGATRPVLQWSTTLLDSFGMERQEEHVEVSYR